ncbi:CDP-diacylglycerol--inositol 3-phosphatidyltransferase 1 [Zea mays]|uniref:CDP-diacylglycerol--inositol 3-phosphatidyltransferase 1 n=1 Tax=Zea mays TaxID=4577 RepID=A0A3L6E7A7_MAIZE|nr:CDP-diacylglycerol--inositol 3-phosphatidyltransferase 1 [Zea mays]
MPSVYLYIPNIIGYFRIIINFVAFAVCYSNKALFAVLYFFSFVLDGVDGWFARKFNQGLALLVYWPFFPSFTGKTSHKDVKHTGNWLLKLYYGYRPFMAFCCVSCEVLYIILFLFADEKSTSLLSACKGLLNQSPIIILVFISTLVGWAVKQVTNVIQSSVVGLGSVKLLLSCLPVMGASVVRLRLDSFSFKRGGEVGVSLSKD